MSHNQIPKSGMSGTRQDGGDTLVASGMSGVFAEAIQEADQASVRQIFRGASDSGGSRQDGGASLGGRAAFAISEQEVEPGGVQQLLAAGAPEPELSGTGFSYRHNWGGRRGQWTLRLNWSAVTARSRIIVSIGEGAAGGPDAGKFLGSARYTLHNVAPRAGGVDIWVNIEWSSDILLYVDYMVVNP